MSEAEPLETPTPREPRGPGVVRWGPWIKWLLIVCVAAEVLWVLIDQLFWHEWLSFGSVARAFEMGEERNASTWFSVLQATLAAFAVFGIYYATRSRGASRRTFEPAS